MPDLRTNEKEWLRRTIREVQPQIRRWAELGDWTIQVCANDALQFIRLAEQLLRIHEEDCERRKFDAR